MNAFIFEINLIGKWLSHTFWRNMLYLGGDPDGLLEEVSLSGIRFSVTLKRLKPRRSNFVMRRTHH